MPFLNIDFFREKVTCCSHLKFSKFSSTLPWCLKAKTRNDFHHLMCRIYFFKSYYLHVGVPPNFEKASAKPEKINKWQNSGYDYVSKDLRNLRKDPKHRNFEVGLWLYGHCWPSV